MKLGKGARKWPDREDEVGGGDELGEREEE